jgi:hypothetical protein
VRSAAAIGAEITNLGLSAPSPRSTNVSTIILSPWPPHPIGGIVILHCDRSGETSKTPPPALQATTRLSKNPAQVKVGGITFAHWGLEMTSINDANRFESGDVISNAAGIVRSCLGSPLKTTNVQRRRHSSPQNPIVVPSYFKLVFLTVVVLTVASAIAHTWLSMGVSPPSESIENFGFCWKTGFGVIIGLIGGKAM